MLPLIPYTFLAADDYAHFRTFVLLSVAGIVSLFHFYSRRRKGRLRSGTRLVGVGGAGNAREEGVQTGTVECWVAGA